MRTGCTGNARGMHIKCARSLSPGLLERSPPRVFVVFVAALLEDLEHVEDVVLLLRHVIELVAQLGGLEPPLLVGRVGPRGGVVEREAVLNVLNRALAELAGHLLRVRVRVRAKGWGRG